MHPVLVDFGGFTIGGRTFPLIIGGYGVMFALAILVAWALATRLGARLAPKAPWTDLFLLTVLSGFLGAKLTNAAISLPKILSGQKTLVGTLLGGGVWFGGVVVGSIAWWILAKKHRIPPGQLGNLVFVVAPLAHAIGRLGCFLGGCCYGTACDLPWAVVYTDPAARRLNGTPIGVPLHPTVLYEAGLELLTFALCWMLWKKRVGDWVIVVVWLGVYGVERFLLEFLRGDPRGFFGPLSTSQWLALGAVGVSVWLALAMRRGATGSVPPARAR